MLLPVLLFVASAVACVAVMVLPGWADLLLIAGPCALASLILLARAAARTGAGRGGRTAGKDEPRAEPESAPVFRGMPKSILVDGSNVLYWKDGTPQIETLRAVVAHLTGLGYAPGVVFDANAGYLVAGKYHDDRAMGAMIGLPEDRVLVVPKGSSADPVLLATARDLGARIVTNDRYRDWAEAHPEIGTPGRLVRGGFGDTGLWLDLGDTAGRAAGGGRTPPA